MTTGVEFIDEKRGSPMSGRERYPHVCRRFPCHAQAGGCRFLGGPARQAPVLTQSAIPPFSFRFLSRTPGPPPFSSRPYLGIRSAPKIAKRSKQIVMKVSYAGRENVKKQSLWGLTFRQRCQTEQLAKVAMPRGSKPGERRGGRQRGTPNKKTVLRNAAISAAATNPNISPLDFLLGLMRDSNLPLEYRAKVAMTALPFVHTKAAVPEDNLASTKYGHDRAGNAGGHAVLKAPPRVRMKRVAGSSAAEGSPLAFLMGAMRGPDAPPGLRIQVARAITPYVHGKLGTAPAEVVVDDEYGFVIDPVAAREIRDHYLEKDRLICTGKFLGTEAEHKFRDRVAEKKKAASRRVSDRIYSAGS